MHFIMYCIDKVILIFNKSVNFKSNNLYACSPNVTVYATVVMKDIPL